jgi:hypothetical protein
MIIESRTQLVELMRYLNLPLVATEVGVAESIWSSELLALGVEKLYLVDIWENIPFIDGCASFDQEWHDKNYEQVKEKFANDSRVVILKGFSHKMANEVPDESLGMVYIDADHSYHGAKADLHSWVRKVVKGGIVAGHDYLNPTYGVNRAVQEFTANEFPIHILEMEQGVNNAGFYFIKK